MYLSNTYLIQAYLPSETPELLRKYRENELVALRGDGTGKLEEWDRVYDYAYSMTWVIQTKAKSMLGLSLEDHLSIRILVEAGQDANQPRQVKTFTV